MWSFIAFISSHTQSIAVQLIKTMMLFTMATVNCYGHRQSTAFEIPKFTISRFRRMKIIRNDGVIEQKMMNKKKTTANERTPHKRIV